MQPDPLKKCFDDFLNALSRNDKERLDALMEDLNIYYEAKKPSELYAEMLHAHVVLFTGTESQIDRNVRRLSKSDHVEDKLACLVGEMRESLPQRTTTEDNTIEKIYDIIGTQDEDYNNIWEALFTAAVKRKDQIEEEFAARIDAYLEKLNIYNRTGGESIGAFLQEEAIDIAQNESIAHHYDFILSHTSFIRGTKKETLDHSFSVVSGSDKLEDKYALVTSICFEPNYYEKLGELLNKAASIVRMRNLQAMMPASKTLH